MGEPIFGNTEIAYEHMDDRRLSKAYWLFRLMNANWLVKVGNEIITRLMAWGVPIVGLVKETIFYQFCGGESLAETQQTIAQLNAKSVDTLLNYSVEGVETPEGYHDTMVKTLESIRFAKENASIRAICIKFTGFASISIWEKVQRNETLSPSEREIFDTALANINTLCQEAVSCDVHLYIDAEESWFQDAIDMQALELMAKYNRGTAYVFNTYQLYRSDKLADLAKDIEWAKSQGVILGAKIVRGAYVEKEQEYAAKHQTLNPIHQTKADTDRDFDEALRLCIEHIDHVSLCCASHNEASNELLYQLMQKHNIASGHPHIVSAQLLGMSDNITYNLAKLGVKTSKYVPYGPVKDVIPYLIRRSQENSSVEGQSSREYSLLKAEKERRRQAKLRRPDLL